MSPLPILAFVILVLGSLQTIAQYTSALPEGVTIGSKAPDFRLMNVDSQMVSLASYRGAKGIIMVFTCNSCPFAQAYEKRIKELHAKYASAGWPVLAINPNDPAVEPEDSFEHMQQRAKDSAYTFAYVADGNQTVAKAYGARRTPHVFLLRSTKTGFVVEYIGAIDDNPRDETAVEARFVEDAIAALEKGNVPEVSTTKAIGCGIKWREN
ncbi:MAG: thioredoxin family protein [Bradyrhizobiaceae bacterium]|nr:thioredoxin family protein [Bradyrhizobiaceae bacterium]